MKKKTKIVVKKNINTQVKVSIKKRIVQNQVFVKNNNVETQHPLQKSEEHMNDRIQNQEKNRKNPWDFRYKKVKNLKKETSKGSENVSEEDEDYNRSGRHNNSRTLRDSDNDRDINQSRPSKPRVRLLDVHHNIINRLTILFRIHELLIKETQIKTKVKTPSILNQVSGQRNKVIFSS